MRPPAPLRPPTPLAPTRTDKLRSAWRGVHGRQGRLEFVLQDRQYLFLLRVCMAVRGAAAREGRMRVQHPPQRPVQRPVVAKVPRLRQRPAHVQRNLVQVPHKPRLLLLSRLPRRPRPPVLRAGAGDARGRGSLAAPAPLGADSACCVRRATSAHL